MPNLYDYRIFISHAWKYGSAYDSLVTLLTIPLQKKNRFSHMAHHIRPTISLKKLLTRSNQPKSLWLYQGCMVLIATG